MGHEETTPEDDTEPLPLVAKNIGKIAMTEEFEHDDFIDGLGLGYDNGDIRGCWNEKRT